MISPRNNTRNTRTRIVVLLLFVGIGGAILWYTPLSEMVGNGVHQLVRPVWSGGFAFTEDWSTFRESWRRRRALVRENEELRREMRQMSAQVLDRNVLREENRELRRMLGREESEETRVVARVVAGPGQSAYDTLVLDVGRASGISQGALVAYGQEGSNLVLGTVSTAHARTAVVTLFSSPGRTIEVNVGPERINTEARGRGGGSFEAQVPRGASIAVGDTVRIPDRHTRIIGTVGHIQKNPNDAFKTIFVKTPVNVYTIKWVEILKDSAIMQ